MLKSEFRPSQLPEFTPPSVPQPALRRAATEYGLAALAAGLGTAYVLLVSYFSRLALAPTIAIGVLLAMHLGTVFIARERQRRWLGLPGLLITVLAALAAPAAAGLADPVDHMDPAGGYVPLPATLSGNWFVHSLRAMADNAGPIVVIIGALISSWFAVHNARPR